MWHEYFEPLETSWHAHFEGAKTPILFILGVPEIAIL